MRLPQLIFLSLLLYQKIKRFTCYKYFVYLFLPINHIKQYDILNLVIKCVISKKKRASKSKLTNQFL